MAQIKLELEKEVYIPYKVIIQLEKDEYEMNKQLWPEEDDYYNYGQHWKLKNSNNYN